MTTATFDFMAPATGKCVPIEAVHHSLSDRTLGEGIAIFPNNNTVVAPPRMLIAFLENNLNEDGSVNIPEALRPYIGGQEKLVPKK